MKRKKTIFLLNYAKNEVHYSELEENFFENIRTFFFRTHYFL